MIRLNGIQLIIFFFCSFQAKVILGEERELMGTLLSIDGTEGVIKTDSGHIKMLPINYLCKAGH